MKKKLVILSSISAACLGAIGVGAAYKATDGMLFAGAASGDVWVHYAKKAATKTEKGIREYWVNCQTNEHVFVAPTGGTIQEGAQYNTSGFTEDDDRWILPVSLTAQDVVMTAQKKALNLGAYAGGVISSIKAGSFDLGVDASNLDVSKFASNHKDDGFYTVEVETVKDDKAYAIYADTTFVTAMISSKEDFLSYCAPEEGVSKFGYYKLATDLNLRGAVTYCSGDFETDYFGGTFDGNGKTVTASSDQTNGLFGNLRFATLKNLNIKDIWNNGGKYVSLLGRSVYQCQLINVTTKLTGATSGLEAGGAKNPEATNGASYFAWNTFQSNTLIDCVFDASGFKIGSLFGCGRNMTPPTVTNTIIKAASLTQAMHSDHTKATYQPENVELKEGEIAIKGLTFVKA